MKRQAENSAVKGKNASPAQDRRKHLRVDLPLKARFLTENRLERPCLVANISAGGALLRAKTPPPAGARVVVYIDQVGRFEGKVARVGRNCFAVAYHKRKAKTVKTADALTEAVNRGQHRLDRRTTPRIGHDASTRIRLEDGRTQECAILDISLTGASIDINPRPPLGAHLILGRMTAKVVRRHDSGVGVVFTGSAERMDDVMAETAPEKPPEIIGAPLAPAFGKKRA